MKRAVTSLDKTISVTSKMFNIKKKVVKYLSNANNNRDSVVEFLYFQKNNAFVCELCETVSITKHFLDSFIVNFLFFFYYIKSAKTFPSISNN